MADHAHVAPQKAVARGNSPGLAGAPPPPILSPTHLDHGHQFSWRFMAVAIGLSDLVVLTSGNRKRQGKEYIILGQLVIKNLVA